MSLRRYAIVRVGEEWRIVSGRQMGHFPTWPDAAAVGARLAREALAAGDEVEMFIQERFGRLTRFDLPDAPTAADQAAIAS